MREIPNIEIANQPVGMPKSENIENELHSDIEKLKGIYQRLVDLKGKDGADIVFREIMNDSSELQTKKRAENLMNLDEARERAFLKFEKMGLMKKTGDGKLIVDVERFMHYKMSELVKSLGPINHARHLGDQKLEKIIPLLFENTKAISKEDFENGLMDERDMLYLPNSKEDALDLDKIRNSKFHFLVSDFVKNQKYEEISYGNIGKEDLDFREVVLPVLIYHPEYGDGYRDEKSGKLFVRDMKTREYRQFTSQYMQESWGGFGPHQRHGESFFHPRPFVKKRLPNLNQAGLLTVNDFTVRIDARNRQLSDRPNPNIKRTGSGSARVMFGNVEHIIGADYLDEDFNAFQLSETEGGIADKDNKLVATFNIIKKDSESVSVKTGKSGRNYYLANIKASSPKPFDKQSMFKKRKMENENEYSERISAYADFPDVLEVSDWLLLDNGQHLWEKFSFKEQIRIATFAKKIGKEKFLNFASEYGIDGLKACSVDELVADSDDITYNISWQNQIDPKFSARIVFRKYNKIIDESVKIKEYLKKSLSLKELDLIDLDMMSDIFIEKAQNILRRLSDGLNKKSVDEVEQELDRINEEVIMFGSTLTYMKQVGIAINWSEIKGAHPMMYEQGELDGEKGEKFKNEFERKTIEMARDNYSRIFKNNPDAYTRVMNAFKDRFNSLIDYRVYMIGVGGDPVFFSVIKPDPDKPDEVTSESTVVHPEATKGAMGIAFLKQIFEREFAEHGVKVIRGVTRVDNPANARYFEMGLEIDTGHGLKEAELNGKLIQYHYEKDGVYYLRLKMEKIERG